MKTIQARTAVAFLIVAGSIAPAFAQGGGNRYGRGREGEGRSQQGRGDDRRGGGEQYRQGNGQEQRYGRDQRYEPQAYRPQAYRQQDYRQQDYRQQSYRQQDYRQQAYRPQYGYAYRDVGMRWADRGGYRGRYIPQDRFYGYFGRQHYFRFGRPAYYNGYQRFSYGGYAFRMLDPIPAYWGDAWYDSDDVYVEYEDDGYYMYNRRYPSVGIAIGIDF